MHFIGTKQSLFNQTCIQQGQDPELAHKTHMTAQSPSSPFPFLLAPTGAQK